MLRKLFSYIGLVRKEATIGVGEAEEPNEVYCQSCGRDITSEGGAVSNTGRIYCHGYNGQDDDRCLDSEFFIQMSKGWVGGAVLFDYRESAKVQKEIRKGRLKEFGKLEKAVEHPPLQTIARSSN